MKVFEFNALQNHSECYGWREAPVWGLNQEISHETLVEMEEISRAEPGEFLDIVRETALDYVRCWYSIKIIEMVRNDHGGTRSVAGIVSAPSLEQANKILERYIEQWAWPVVEYEQS